MSRLPSIFTASLVVASISLFSDFAQACDYTKAQTKDAKTLLDKGIARGQPYPFLLTIEKGSELHSALLQSSPDHYSAILNARAPEGITFSVSVKKINLSMFRNIGMLPFVAICHDRGDSMNALDLAERVRAIDGIFAASPDTFLYRMEPKIRRIPQ